MALSMNFSKTESEINTLAKPLAEELGFLIYDIEYVKEGGTRFLRVFLDKNEGGINIDECEEFSRAFSEILDKKDPIKENYFLEVSSPGIERKIRRKEHFDLNRGEMVDIGLYKAHDGSKNIVGELIGLCDDCVCIISDGEEIKIPIKETTNIKVHFEF